VTVKTAPSATCTVISVVAGGKVVTQQLTAGGGNGGPYTYALLSGPAWLTVSSSGLLTAAPLADVAAGSYSYKITITDVNGNTGTLDCTVTVKTAPSATCTVINLVAGGKVVTQQLTAGGGNGGPYTYALVSGPAWLSVSPGGLLTAAPLANVAAGSYSYKITITDASGNTGTLDCSVTVNPSPSGTCTVITVVAGKTMTQQLSAAGGNGGPYTYALLSGPAWLTVSSSGLVTAAPGATITAGSYSYRIAITDVNGNTGALDCSVTVTSVPTATCVSITAIQGVAITPVTMTATGGTGSGYTYTVTGLPAGLVMSTGGTISGTPTVSGTFTYTVTVRDSAGNTDTATCSVTVAASQSNVCGLTWGYWKNHVSLWPASAVPMKLGAFSYYASELQTILNKAVAGDVSIELAHQLIAAKFNVGNGTNASTANGAIDHADQLLAVYATAKMGVNNYWYKVASSANPDMVTTAKSLDYFNSDGKAQPGCSTTTSGCNGTIGNWVWIDADHDGFQDLGEKGLPGVTVQLRDANNNLIATTVTDANGQYQFTNLCAGVYIVTIVPPPGYMPTLVNAASAGLDKDSNGSPTTVVLTTNNSSNMDTDFGFYSYSATCSASIGNLVWYDKDGDGIQDSAEPGIPGVLVSLSYGSYGVIQTAITDANGNYLFTGLCAATGYSVSVTTPPGFTPTKTGAGSTSTDSNSNPATVNLSSDTYSDLTVDFGFKTLASTATAYTTYTQGGWGAKPNGNNPGTLLQSHFASVYPTGESIGANYKLTFTSAPAVQGFLPQGGTAGVLASSPAANPTTSLAGVFAGQVLALNLSVDFSNAGWTKKGLAALKVVTGKLAGYSVQQVLDLAQKVLGGTTSALPSGVSLTDLNSVVDSINNNYDNGTVNKGYLQ
jgi:hypothetical protein